MFFMALLALDTEMSRSFRKVLRGAIESDLVNIDTFPEDGSFDALYILGGRHKSQRYKFEVASRIYQQELSRKIIFLSVAGTTAYSQELARNLTNDEWSFLEMEKLGIHAKDVKAFAMGKALFGTMNEANNISRLALQNNYKNLLVVAAPYHSQRVRSSYDHYLKNSNITLTILGSGEPVYLRYLLLEWIKLRLYQFVFMTKKVVAI